MEVNPSLPLRQRSLIFLIFVVRSVLVDNPDPQRDQPPSAAATAYRLIYGRVDALLRGRGEVAEVTVPACPAWTVRQTVAHLAGVAEDVVSLNLHGAGTDSWTRAQVDRLGGNSVDGLLDLWGQAIDPVTARLGKGAPESAAGQLVFDALTHEHDVRGALGEPGSCTGDLAFEVAMGFRTATVGQVIRETGLPALRLTTPTIGSVQLGDPRFTTGQVTLDVSDFEALRALGGRRSIRQLLALPWRGDPTELLAALGNVAVRPPNDDLIE